MAGRKSHPDRGGSGHREQSAKNPRGFARGHGAHHRHKAGAEAPRRLGSGRDRTDARTRSRSYGRLDDESLADLQASQKNTDVEHRLRDLEAAGGFGARLEGTPARGVVVEVRKGNFLTRLAESPIPNLQSPIPNRLLRTFVRGTLQQFDLGLSSLVAPGDEIEIVIPESFGQGELFRHERHGVLTKVLPRRNEFRRLHPSGRAIQTLAANVDRVCIVASTALPDFRPGFVDRVLVCAASSGLPAALIVNKLDLGLRAEDEELLRVYRDLGVPVFLVSTKDAQPHDWERLAEHLAGSRSVFTGHSGVGKSSLLLALDPSLREEDVRIGGVSTQTHKGTHTTTHARLFPIMLGRASAGTVGRASVPVGAELIDTPGVREFTPADTDRRNLWGWFPELARLQGQCEFSSCTHTLEQGCAVLAAVERGEIHPRRHQSYVRIFQTLPM